MALLKQSTARNREVLMTLASDHVTGATGLTLTITASKDGAAFASITPVVTELANGWYSVALTAAHTNTLGDLCLHITAPTADPTDTYEQVVVDLPGATVASVSGAVGSVTGAVGSVTAGVSLSAAAIQAIWDAATTALTTAGSIGKLLVDNVNTALSGIAAAVWAVGARTITGGTIGTYTGNTPQTGDVFPRVGANGAGLTAVGDTRLANLDALVSSRLAASSYVSPDNAAAQAAAAAAASADSKASAINAKTINLPATPAAVGSLMTLDLAELIPVSPAAGSLGMAFAAALNLLQKRVYAPPASNPGTGSFIYYAKDGTTILATQVVTTDSSGNITSVV